MKQSTLEYEMKALGERFALLLAATSLDDDVKEAWVTLLPEMNLRQIDMLIKLLEREISKDLAEELREFHNDLVRIKDTFHATVQAKHAKAQIKIQSAIKSYEGDV